jgi:SAM-dependent methyltransferase
MLNYHSRSTQKELLDGDSIPWQDVKQNLKELNGINTYLGGHAITVEGVKKLLPRSIDKVHIVEIGCGGGDNLNAIYAYLSKLDIDFFLTGIDLKKECIAFAKEKYPDIHFICSDYQNVFFDEKPSLIFCSLFCHHFYDQHLHEVIQWMHQNSKFGFFINDLQRHPIAYYSIKILTSLFSKSYLVKNDAPLSVARGFRKKEWESILAENQIPHFSILWKWAFRHLILVRHGT